MELLVHIVPILVGIWMSFYKLTQLYIAHWQDAPFAGLSNYKLAVDINAPIGRGLLDSMGLTLLFTVLMTLLSWGFGFAAAIALQGRFRGRGVFRTMFIIPYALPGYAGVVTWNFMLQRDDGLVNQLLVKDLGILTNPPFWLLGNNAFFSTLVVALWRSWPFAFLMLTAGLQSIPTEIYDAAAVDGAGPWRQIRLITVPMLRSVNVTLILIMGLWSLNDFGTPYLLFGKNVPPAADFISVHVYNTSFSEFNFGLGSAQSVVMLAFLAIVVGGYLRLTRGRSDA